MTFSIQEYTLGRESTTTRADTTIGKLFYLKGAIQVAGKYPNLGISEIWAIKVETDAG